MWCHACLLVLIVSGAIANYYGECWRQPEDELIWEYEVRRSYRLGAYQEAEAEYGPTRAIITCIEMKSLSSEDNTAAWVTGGGIGQNFLRLKFRSKYSQGLHYKVFVYGRSIWKEENFS